MAHVHGFDQMSQSDAKCSRLARDNLFIVELSQAQLKTALRFRGLSIDGNKHVLAERLRAHLESRKAQERLRLEKGEDQVTIPGSIIHHGRLEKGEVQVSTPGSTSGSTPGSSTLGSSIHGGRVEFAESKSDAKSEPMPAPELEAEPEKRNVEASHRRKRERGRGLVHLVNDLLFSVAELLSLREVSRLACACVNLRGRLSLSHQDAPTAYMTARRHLSLVNPLNLGSALNGRQMLSVVRRMAGLHYVSIGGIPCSPEILSELCKTAVSLRELAFKWNRWSSPVSVTYVRLLDSIRACTALKTLTLAGSCPSFDRDRVFSFVLPQITCVRLHRLHNMPSTSFDRLLAAVPNLTALTLPVQSGSVTMLKMSMSLSSLQIQDGYQPKLRTLLPLASLRCLDLGQFNINSLLSLPGFVLPSVEKLRMERGVCTTLVPHFPGVTHFTFGCARDTGTGYQQQVPFHVEFVAFPQLLVFNLEMDPERLWQLRTLQHHIAETLVYLLTHDSSFMPILQSIEFKCGDPLRPILSETVTQELQTQRPSITISTSPEGSSN